MKDAGPGWHHMEAFCVGFDVPPAEGGFAARAERALRPHPSQPRGPLPTRGWLSLGQGLSQEQQKIPPPASPPSGPPGPETGGMVGLDVHTKPGAEGPLLLVVGGGGRGRESL